jgi:hypothetical protein
LSNPAGSRSKSDIRVVVADSSRAVVADNNREVVADSNREAAVAAGNIAH